MVILEGRKSLGYQLWERQLYKKLALLLLPLEPIVFDEKMMK